MVAKTPMKERRVAVSLNPNLVRETVKKVDRCMARLQDLQYTVAGGSKVVSGVSLSPRSTRGYLVTSLRCKQESLRMKNAVARKSPPGKFQGSLNGEWRRMSLPAMLLGETVLEILQASQFAKEVAAAAAKLHRTKAFDDPKTPIRRNNKPRGEGTTELRSRRTKEKQHLRRSIRLESGSPALPRARSRISFKANSPLNRKDAKNVARPTIAAHKVSPRNRPWAKKTVLFPNPLFHSTSPSSSHQQQRFYKTRSPIITRSRQQMTPHKFRIKSPPTSLKSQLDAVVPAASLSSPVEKVASSSSRPCRCSFSPVKLASRLISPLKIRSTVQRSSATGLISGLKQRPSFGTPVRIPSTRRS